LGLRLLRELTIALQVAVCGRALVVVRPQASTGGVPHRPQSLLLLDYRNDFRPDLPRAFIVAARRHERRRRHQQLLQTPIRD
jgi:hypothetical protein